MAAAGPLLLFTGAVSGDQDPAAPQEDQPAREAPRGTTWYDDCMRAWREREESTRTLRIEWTEERTIEKGAQNWIVPVPGPPREVPSERQVTQNDHSLVLSGDKAYYSANDNVTVVDEKTSRTVPRKYQSAYDGVEPRKLRVSGTGQPPVGFIEVGKTLVDSRDLSFFPAILNVRGSRSELALQKASRLRPLPDQDEVDGAVCHVLQVIHPLSIERYHVNPRVGYRIERLECLHTNLIPAYRIDFSYQNDQTTVVKPSGWTKLSFSDKNTISRSSRCVVKVYEVDPRVDDSVFTLVFPPGTLVTENRTGRQFVVQADGRERTVLPGEWRQKPTWEELMSTDTGGLHSSRARGRYFNRTASYVAIASLAAVISIVAYKVLREKF